MNEFEKSLNGIIEVTIKAMGTIIKKIFLGTKRLRNVKSICGLLLSVVVTLIVARYRSLFYEIAPGMDMPIWVKHIIYGLLLSCPLIYLIILNELHEKGQEKYQKLFNEIGFKGKDGKYPYFINCIKGKGGKIYFIFKSSIPLKDWQAAQNKLEAAFDCNIIQISNKSSKKVVQLETISSELDIPRYIEWDDSYISDKDGVIVIGRTAFKDVQFDLNRTPHVLMAGETGSGKSVLLRLCVWEMIFKGARIVMLDFKGGVEFGIKYEAYGEVITERKRALKVLTQLCEENKKRLELFRRLEVKNLYEYNQKTGKNLCRIAVFCDEIGEMLDKKGAQKEEKEIIEQTVGRISTLARLSRATGINLFLGVQRPDANVLTGQIKNNIPVRVCGRFADKAASEIVLGSTAATNLPEIKGRFLFKLGNEQIEFQAYYADDDKMLKEIDVESGDTLTHLDFVVRKEKESETHYEESETLKQYREGNYKKDDNTELDLDFDNIWGVENEEKEE